MAVTVPNPVSPTAIWSDPDIRSEKLQDQMRWAARTNGKFRLRTANQLLECTLQLQQELSRVRFPFCAMHSAHDEAVLHTGSVMLFEQAATPTTVRVQLKIILLSLLLLSQPIARAHTGCV